jgi:hypothetical protein
MMFADFINAIVDWLGQLDVAAWVIIGLGLALAVLTWLGFVGQARLGSIEIEPVTADDGSPLPTTAATAQLQDELGKVGLLPAGGVPAGSPTAALVAAIDAAPVAQAQWLGTLVGLLPIPATSQSFKVSSTLRDDGEPPTPSGLTYSIVDVAAKSCLCVETAWAATPAKAVEAAANDMFRTIVAHAPDVFPTWAQWSSAEALDCYRKGLECERPRSPDVKQRYTKAIGHFVAASRLDPKNVLARLRIGNSLERLAGCEQLGTQERTRLWAEALNAYAPVIAQHHEIFEPRYRASVVMGQLADHLGPADEQIRNQLRWVLRTLEPDRPPEEGDLDERLRVCAGRQSKQAWKRLRPLWTLFHGGRMRRQFEPTGKTRRQHRRALALSNMCLRVRRQWHAGQPLPWRTAMLRLWWRGWIDVRHFRFRWARAGWQAHYNAAAFYALLPEASLDVRPQPVKDKERPSKYSVNVRRPREKAFDHLTRAIDDPDNDLRAAYVRNEDPDLLVLRAAEKESWDAAMVRLAGPEVIVHYQRGDQDYAAWSMRVGTGQLLDGAAVWSEQPIQHVHQDGWGAVFRIPLYDVTKCVDFKVIDGSGPAGEVWGFTPSSLPKPEVWVIWNDAELYLDCPAG